MVNASAKHVRGSAVRRETRDGVNYLVSRVVPIAEGVHAGNIGPKFYPFDALAATADGLNGRPLIVYHAQDDAGQFISADTPGVYDAQGIGFLDGIHADPELRALVGEVWIDEQRAHQVDPRVPAALYAGQPIDVSTGIASMADDHTAGTWNGEPFTGTVSNFGWDHNAVLPDVSGACGLGDGCGIRANQSSEVRKMEFGEKVRSAIDRVVAALGAKMTPAGEVVANESLTARNKAVRDAIYALDNTGWSHLVEDVQIGPDLVVYEAMPVHSGAMNPSTMKRNPPSQYFRRSYSLNQNGAATLGDDVVEVREKSEWIPVTTTANADQSASAKKEEQTMSKEALVSALVACACNGITEDHRATLMGLDEKTLEAMQVKLPVANAAPAPAPTPAPPAAPVSLETLIANAAGPEGEAVRELVELGKATKTTLIGRIVANHRNRFEKEKLAAMSLGDLRNLAALAGVDVDNAARAGSANASMPDPMAVNADVPKLVRKSVFAGAAN